jgi:hypothetical protein
VRVTNKCLDQWRGWSMVSVVHGRWCGVVNDQYQSRKGIQRPTRFSHSSRQPQPCPPRRVLGLERVDAGRPSWPAMLSPMPAVCVGVCVRAVCVV